jgi:large subunit ribosomal protein L10
VKALATLPSLDELRGKLIGLIQAPATKVAGVLAAPAGQLARVLNAYATKEAA